MNLPKVVTELIKTQNNFDSAAYANVLQKQPSFLMRAKRTMEEKK